MPPVPVQILSKPGIKRDGTRLDSAHYIDGEWVRFRNGKPRKMLGYRTLTNLITEPSRGLHSWSQGNTTYVHTGGATSLQMVRIQDDGTAAIPVTRTPATLATSDELNWQFAAIYNNEASTTQEMKILAHAGNAHAIDSETEYTVWQGGITGTSALTAVFSSGVTPLQVSGGVCAVHPFAFYYGNNGQVIWSRGGEPVDVADTATAPVAGEANITSQKIVLGRPIRGAAGYSPAALFWSLDRLHRASYVGGAPMWQFDELASIEILSPAAVVEYDGNYYWPGIGRFLMYNGAVREIPNDVNLDFFFDAIDWDHRAHIFGFAVPAQGEIWWCFSRGHEHGDHAVIFNVREQTWYDTPLPHSGRSAALSPAVHRFPIMAGVDETDGGTYRLWQHEVGLDEVDGGSVSAIRSFFETSDLTNLKGAKPSLQELDIVALEPDFRQVGDLQVTITGNANARSPEREGQTFTVTEEASGREQEILRFSEARRQVRFRVESNTLGGDYELGATYAHVQPRDGQVTS
jgi:hypothetical protein